MQVETIGDAYMCAANLVDPDPYHAATMVRFALRAQEEAAKVPRPDTDDGSTLSLRIGEAGLPCMQNASRTGMTQRLNNNRRVPTLPVHYV